MCDAYGASARLCIRVFTSSTCAVLPHFPVPSREEFGNEKQVWVKWMDRFFTLLSLSHTHTHIPSLSLSVFYYKAHKGWRVSTGNTDGLRVVPENRQHVAAECAALFSVFSLHAIENPQISK